MILYDREYEEVDAQDLPPVGVIMITTSTSAFNEYYISRRLSDNPDVDPEHIATFKSKYWATIAACAIEKETENQDGS